MAKGELLVSKINHDQVSAEQRLGLTKVRTYLFLMRINPNGRVIPWNNLVYYYKRPILPKPAPAELMTKFYGCRSVLYTSTCIYVSALLR